MTTRQITPVDLNMRVIDPTTQQPLPPEGIVTEWSPYWANRLADGDIEIVDPNKPAAKPVAKVEPPKVDDK